MPNKTIITQALPVYTASPGTADIIGFGQNGVLVLRNSVKTITFNVVNSFSVAQGWDVTKHPRLVAVTTNAVPVSSDIVGFGDAGVYISINNGDNTFTDPVLVIKDFGYINGGWRVDKHIRYMADLRKTGRADIIGFGDNGVVVSQNLGGGNFGPGQNVVADFGYLAGGWRLDRHLRFLADVTGDGYLDIIGFGESQVLIGRNNTTGGFEAGQGVLANFTPAQGWAIDKHPRVIADLTGDGKADIVGFGQDGVWVSWNNGSGGFGAANRVVNDFAYDAGEWRVEKHPRFVADLTGDGKGDIIGFGEEGVWVSLNNGNGTFHSATKAISDFCYSTGWRVDKHPRFVVDLTGDGRADIIGFGEDSTFVSFNDGNGGFGPVIKLTTDFAFNGGQWAMDKTVRWAANLYQ